MNSINLFNSCNWQWQIFNCLLQWLSLTTYHWALYSKEALLHLIQKKICILLTVSFYSKENNCKLHVSIMKLYFWFIFVTLLLFEIRVKPSHKNQLIEIYLRCRAVFLYVSLVTALVLSFSNMTDLYTLIMYKLC